MEKQCHRVENLKYLFCYNAVITDKKVLDITTGVGSYGRSEEPRKLRNREARVLNGHLNRYEGSQEYGQGNSFI